MIHDWKMEVYWRLPVALQEAGLSVFAKRLDRLYYGPDFEEWCARYRVWKAWTFLEERAWQDRELARMIPLAARQVPFYREAWHRVDWSSVRSADTLRLLPRLDKRDIQRNERSFLVDGLDPRSLRMEKTSGSTGTALHIYWPKSMLPRWWALTEVLIRNAAGVAQNVPRAMMGGRPIVPGGARKPPYWRFNRHWRQLYLSSYHVRRESAQGYVDAMRQYGSEWITGYGSAIAALAESALAAGVEPMTLRAAIVSGDTLTDGMRASIEAFFRCRCYDSYGQSEGVAMTMECERGRMHVLPGIGVLEILREDGSPADAGEVGEMVATSLLNDAMPLIRYRTGDYAAFAGDQACPCGSARPVIESLEGRVDDYLETADGRRIGRLSTAIKRSPTIAAAQIVQDRPGHAFLLVRPADGYIRKHAEAVRDDIVERIGAFAFEILEVPEIPKTPAGKTRLVVRLGEKPQAVQEIYHPMLSGAS